MCHAHRKGMPVPDFHRNGNGFHVKAWVLGCRLFTFPVTPSGVGVVSVLELVPSIRRADRLNGLGGLGGGLGGLPGALVGRCLVWEVASSRIRLCCVSG